MSSKEFKRKVILDLAVTLDGFIEGANGEIDWCIMDSEMQFIDFLNSIDTILYGRKSYELSKEYIPEDEDLKEMLKLFDSKKKYVFSRKGSILDDKVKVINNNILEEVNKLKKEEGKDIWLYGGSEIITIFMNLNLIDEYRISVHPIVLGGGKALFSNIENRVKLKLTNTKSFSSGVVQLFYETIR